MVRVDLSRIARVLPSRGVAVLAAFLLACGGSSGPGAPGTAPAIAGLHLWSQTANVGEGGGAVTVSFSFGVVDPDADVARIVVKARDAAGELVSRVEDAVSNPPGETAAWVEGFVAIPTTAPATFDLEAQAFDARGNGSNLLTARFGVVGANPVPAVASLSPERIAAGSADLTLTVTGTGFVPGAAVTWDGAELTTTYVDGETLEAQVGAYRLYYTGTAQVRVTNPPPGGGSSSPAAFVVEPPTPNPIPTISSLSPARVDAGTQGFTLTVTGSGFVAGSRALWNGSFLETSYVDGETLRASIPDYRLQAVGAVSVSVSNPTPGGGTSASLPFTVATPAQPGVTFVALKANDLAWDPYARKIYASVPSTSTIHPNSVAALDPFTGEVTGSTWVGSEPDRLSVSGDGGLLYVVLRGASSLERLSLPALVPELSIDLGRDPMYGPYYASDVQVAPTSPRTIAVSLTTLGVGSGSGGIVVFDDGTPRPNKGGSATYYSPFVSLQWDHAAAALYAASTGYGYDLYGFAVDASGASLRTTYRNAFTTYGVGFALDAGTGLAYAEDGRVVDPANGAVEGTFPVSSLYSRRVVPDSSLGSAFFASSTSSYPGEAGHVQITTFDLGRYVETSTATVRFAGGPPRRLVRWGTDGLAFLAPASVVLVRGPAVLPPSTTPNGTPTVVSLSPPGASAGAPNLLLTVDGADFVRGSTVLWNGSERTTTFVSATRLLAYVPASDLAAAGQAEVAVASPAPGGGTSAATTFLVDP